MQFTTTPESHSNNSSNPPLVRHNLSKLILFVFMVAGGVGAAVITSRFIGPLPFSVNQTTTQKQTTFDVTGKAELYTVPDEAEVNVGANITQSTVALAQKEANRIVNTITNDLKQLGVNDNDIKTTQYNIYPQYDYNGGAQRITGYNVNISLNIKLRDLEKVNEVLDIAVRSGANQVNGVNFVLSKEKEQAVTKQVREQAIADAKRNAEELARLSGMRLGRIVNVAEQNYGGGPIPIMARAESMGLGGGAADTKVQPGTATVTFNVTLSYETL